MEGVSLAFESKSPHTTAWLSVEFEVGHPPDDLLESLAEIGWKEDERFNRMPPLDNRQEIHLRPPSGSDLFGGWNDEERQQNMNEIRTFLRKRGFNNVPWHRLTLEELL